MQRIFRSAAIVAAFFALQIGAVPAVADDGIWESVRSELYGTRDIADGRGVIVLKAPARPEDQRQVPVDIEARLADGRSIKKITLVLDNNPSPVAAVFTLSGNRDRAHVSANVRLNQQTQVRAIVETNDGALYMAQQLVKFAGGQAACAAPPSGDPAEVAANMGKMTLTDAGTASAPARASSLHRSVRLALSHPNHTGMQMDQITLLYIPLRMISRIEVDQGGELALAIDGSISLSENPRIEFDYVRNGTDELKIKVQDTSGASWTKAFPAGAGS